MRVAGIVSIEGNCTMPTYGRITLRAVHFVTSSVLVDRYFTIWTRFRIIFYPIFAQPSSVNQISHLIIFFTRYPWMPYFATKALWDWPASAIPHFILIR